MESLRFTRIVSKDGFEGNIYQSPSGFVWEWGILVYSPNGYVEFGNMIMKYCENVYEQSKLLGHYIFRQTSGFHRTKKQAVSCKIFPTKNNQFIDPPSLIQSPDLQEWNPPGCRAAAELAMEVASLLPTETVYMALSTWGIYCIYSQMVNVNRYTHVKICRNYIINQRMTCKYHQFSIVFKQFHGFSPWFLHGFPTQFESKNAWGISSSSAVSTEPTGFRMGFPRPSKS